MSNKIFIGLIGRRNQGKSSIMNALTGQNISIVSDIPGTTTDPVKKAVELFGLGNCVIIDTAGSDDSGKLGRERVEKTTNSIDSFHVAIIVFSHNEFSIEDKNICLVLKQKHIPFILLHNKKDEEVLSDTTRKELSKAYPDVPLLDFSTKEGSSMEGSIETSLITDAIKSVIDSTHPKSALFGVIKEGDMVLLVTPIDAEAPEGRLILPQVQITRQCLDLHASCLLCQTEELSFCLQSLAVKPRLVITDSQAFAQVAKILPKEQELTSFSICLAKQKGPFEIYKEGTKHIANLKNSDKILMLESCTHQTSCYDIGRVKLPALLQSKTGKTLSFEFVSGLSPLPKDPLSYAMVIQCGGCMVTAKQLENRLSVFTTAGIPISNYGMCLSFLQGIFDRAVAPFEFNRI